MAIVAKSYNVTDKGLEPTTSSTTSKTSTTSSKTITAKSYNVTDQGKEQVSTIVYDPSTHTSTVTDTKTGITTTQVQQPSSPMTEAEKTIVLKNLAVEGNPVAQEEMIKIYQSQPSLTKEEATKLIAYQYDTQLWRFQDQKQDINPRGLYYQNIGDKQIIVPGRFVISRLSNYQKNINKNKLKSLSGFSGYPSDTKFIPTSEGFDVEYSQAYIDEQQLSWGEYYGKKAENLPPGLSQLSSFGMGLEKDIFSMTKPVANFFGFGKEFDTAATVGFSSAFMNPFDSKAFLKDLNEGLKHTEFGVHYTSPLDYAFEPLGLSPKGSTKYLGEHPWELAGGIGGEIGQVAAFAGVTSGITKGVQTGAKFVFKTTPKVTSKFSKLFPEAVNIFEKVPGSKYVSGALTKSGINENLEKWAVYGYRPGKTLAEVSAGQVFKNKLGMNVQKYVFKPDTTMGFWERRTWMSPAEYLEYQNRLASSGSLKIGFPTAKIEETAPDVFEGRIIGVTEGETFKKGVFGGVRGRSYIWDTMEKEVGESSAGISSKDFSYNIITKNKPYYGRTIKDILKEESKINELEHPVFNLGEKNQWFYKTQEMWKGGYGNKSFFINTFIDETTGEFKTGVIAKGEVVTGFGSGRTQIFERFSEGPVFGYRYGYKPNIFSRQTISDFIKDIRASTSISRSEQMTSGISLNKMFGGTSADIAFSTITVPTKSMIPSIGIAGMYGASKIRSDLKDYNQPSIKIFNRELQNVYFNIPKHEKESVGISLIDFKMPSQETGSLSKTLQFQIPEYDSRLSYKYVQQQIPVQDYKQLYITLPKLEGKTVYQKVPKWDTPYKATVKFPLIPWSIPGGEGIGAGGGWGKYLGKGYRFRKWKVPKLEDILGGW